MRVAIWGSYNHGNYGDDLMAVMFAIHLKELGYNPLVYRMSESIAAKYNIDSTDNLDALLNNVEFCIIGGGAWLTTKGTPLQVESDCKIFREKLEMHNCPFYCISIGGDGNTNFSDLSYERQDLFKSNLFMGGTVRLKTDVILLKDLNAKIIFYPDIVFLASDFFNIPNRNTVAKKTLIIGLNINKTQTKLNKIFKLIARITKKVEIVYVNSHLEDLSPGYELKDKKTKNINLITYEDPKKFIFQLSELDYLISFKLHLGITALGMGVNFISVGGLDKTKQQLNELNYPFRINSFFKMLCHILLNLFSSSPKLAKPPIAVKKIKTESIQHFEFISSIDNLYSSNQISKNKD